MSPRALPALALLAALLAPVAFAQGNVTATSTPATQEARFQGGEYSVLAAAGLVVLVVIMSIVVLVLSMRDANKPPKMP